MFRIWFLQGIAKETSVVGLLLKKAFHDRDVGSALQVLCHVLIASVRTWMKCWSADWIWPVAVISMSNVYIRLGVVQERGLFPSDSRGWLLCLEVSLARKWQWNDNAMGNTSNTQKLCLKLEMVMFDAFLLFPQNPLLHQLSVLHLVSSFEHLIS